MLPFLRFLFQLLTGAWAGAILCFAAVLAPSLFAVLSPEQAGSVVRLVIPKLDVFGMVAGPVALAIAVGHDGTPRGGRQLARAICLVLVTALVCISFFGLTPRMEELRQAAEPSISALPREDPLRREFGMLHGISTLVMLGELLLVVVALALAPRPVLKSAV